MKAKILIIEDVRELAELISLYLEKDGMETRRFETAESALECLASFQPDLVVLDLNLPGMDGFEFLQRFRKTFATPVLIVSARDADEDIISGLGSGADEFVTKPFSPRVLVARVRAMIRRVQDSAQPAGEETFAFGDFVLYRGSCLLKKGDERIPLSAKEFAILLFLVQNANKPLAPEVIYSEVWKNAYGDLSAVAVYIQRLRKKIEADPVNPRFIETVFGMGYRFNPSAHLPLE
jgi:two-component system response regulator RegX3